MTVRATSRTRARARSSALALAIALAFAVSAPLLSCAASGPGGLPRRSFDVGGKKVTLEIAATDPERMRGLMYRDALGEDEGMIFLFTDEVERSFWMRNCRIDLSIAYLDRHGKIVSILEMKKPEPGDYVFESYPSTYPAQFAIEMRPGWFADHGVKPGVVVKIPDDVRAMARP